jgi:DNA-binding transcriptional LysR family regulator
MGINDVDVQMLRRFVAVAEDQSFSRAARRLGLAQPPLSRAIRGLEDAIGAPLFTRTTRRVELTAAGRALLDDARAAITGVEAAVHRARRAAARTPQLVVASKAAATGLVNRIVRRYEQIGGAPKVKIRVGGWGEPEAMLADGRADAALVRVPTDPAFAYEILLEEPRVAALPAAHRHARRRSLRRADLDGEAVPTWPPASPELAAFRAAVTSVADLARVPAGPPVSDLSQLLAVVALGQGVAFIPASLVRQARWPGVVFVPVHDIAPSRGGIAWPRAIHSQATRTFVRAAVEVARSARRPLEFG